MAKIPEVIRISEQEALNAEAKLAWQTPVNAGLEVVRLGDDYIVELKRQHHWIDFEVWEIASAECDPVPVQFLDGDYDFNEDRSAAPPNLVGHMKWDDEMVFNYPHRARQLYGIAGLDKEIQLTYWLPAMARNQFGDDEYGQSKFKIPFPDTWAKPPVGKEF